MIKDKIKKINTLKGIIAHLKKHGKKIAFTNGCFDILHFGHVNYLERAKGLADKLVVAINSDNSIRRLKGKGRPILTLRERMQIIAALESVDYVTSFSQDIPLNIIKLLKPDVLVKGGDWDRDRIIGKQYVESYGGCVITLPFIKGRSSSKIIKRIVENF